MVYILMNNETETPELYRDATQVAEKMGVSTQTIWYNSKKLRYDRGKYTLFYCPEGIIKSKRGNKKGYVVSNAIKL